jgi:hypothetical protein
MTVASMLRLVCIHLSCTPSETRACGPFEGAQSRAWSGQTAWLADEPRFTTTKQLVRYLQTCKALGNGTRLAAGYGNSLSIVNSPALALSEVASKAPTASRTALLDPSAPNNSRLLIELMLSLKGCYWIPDMNSALNEPPYSHGH